MRLFILSILLFAVGLQEGFSQEISEQTYHFKVVYNYSYVPDSTKDVKREEKVVLLATKDNKSFYQSLNGYYKDSVSLQNYKTNGAGLNNGSMAFAMMLAKQYPSRFNTVIYKNMPTNIKVVEPLGLQKYWYEDIPPIKWQILEDTDSINGVFCQKAVSHYLGRVWTAWFSSSIAISDGPDRFYGLPGLIIKLEDAQHFFSWQLLSLSQGVYTVEHREEKLIKAKRNEVIARRMQGNNNPNPLALFGTTVKSEVNTQNQNSRVVENNLVDRTN